jgi:hypothetical protein
MNEAQEPRPIKRPKQIPANSGAVATRLEPIRHT